MDKYPHIRDNNLSYDIKFGDYREYTYNTRAFGGTRLKMRNLFFSNEYIVNATNNITRYHIMSNLLEQPKTTSNCRTYVCEVLKIPYYEGDNPTNEQMAEHIKQHAEHAYILGENVEDKPYDHNIHKY